ncbi:fimbrial protein [Serratia fonticola]|uniref:fimbrial protein n=1 Tax=Serratia fonticola TaxID=47917 RepID=UPI0027FDAB82|nr:fimbrial protein [Serratia fonticola]MDQ7209083.1 fimbrial protein [Serratia fonticola]HBE9082937.1 type 1 fimbrial protein [Serratia fonticola]HBE9093428.1 type 1 fimbrial protein [Serratia fonticola]HBE9152370.1 type 1 fimbrial protein [Serratia fonticola]
MKFYNTKTTLLAAVIGMTFAGSALAADGTITINGTITDTTCDISVNNQSKDATVTLPTVSTSALASPGATAGTTTFAIVLNNCAGATLNTASTFFEAGDYVEQSSGRLNNSASGTATGVQVELLNANQSKIMAGSDFNQGDIATDISSGSGVMNYFARYYAKGAVTPGTVNTQVDYTIIYL